jgi:DNA-binding transcriptional MocR family regulator
MSINKLSQVMKTPMPDPIAKFIMVVLADHYNDSTGTCWPSIDTITEITGCSRRTVIRKLKMLEEAGLIIRYKRYNKTDIYEIFIGDTLTRDTVTPLGVTGWHTNSYRTLNKKKGGKIKISEWQLDDECRQYAKGKGLSPDGIMDSIRLWDEQNGNKAAYASPSAFFKNWCKREADKPQRGYSKPTGDNFGVAQKKVFNADEWDALSDTMKRFYKQNRPSAIPEARR